VAPFRKYGFQYKNGAPQDRLKRFSATMLQTAGGKSDLIIDTVVHR
jgi:hypothetical protein